MKEFLCTTTSQDNFKKILRERKSSLFYQEKNGWFFKSKYKDAAEKVKISQKILDFTKPKTIAEELSVVVYYSRKAAEDLTKEPLLNEMKKGSIKGAISSTVQKF